MVEIDYNKFDKFSLYVKKEMKDEIVENYAKFGWELIDVKLNMFYDDIIDLTFKRPHIISNKDELQLSQVYMEDKINEIGKLNKNKDSKSTEFAMLCGLCGFCLFVGAVLFYLNLSKPLNVWLAAVSIVGGCVFFAVLFVFFPKVKKKEQRVFEETRKRLYAEVGEICSRAELLRRGSNENKS